MVATGWRERGVATPHLLVILGEGSQQALLYLRNRVDGLNGGIQGEEDGIMALRRYDPDGMRRLLEKVAHLSRRGAVWACAIE